MKVKIPFYARFKEPLLNGTKTWTSRTKRYGKIGDTFDAFGATFAITDIKHWHLSFVTNHWKEEGCESREDFIQLWQKIHPRKGYDPYQQVYVHIFRRMTKI